MQDWIFKMGWPDTLNPSSTWVATKLCMYHDLFVLLQATTWSPYTGPYFLLLRIRGLHSFAKSFLKSHQKFFSKILNCGLSYLCTTVYWKDSCCFSGQRDDQLTSDFYVNPYGWTIQIRLHLLSDAWIEWFQ